MSLTQKFSDAVAGCAVNITALRIGKRCPVLQCDPVCTKYGDAVRLTLREEGDDNILRVFLPRHYGSAMSDDMAGINGRRITYFLTRGLVLPRISLCYRWMSDPFRLSIAGFHRYEDLGQCLQRSEGVLLR